MITHSRPGANAESGFIDISLMTYELDRRKAGGESHQIGFVPMTVARIILRTAGK